MANKKRLTLLQQQKAKLKKQRALTANPKTRKLISQKIQQVEVRIVNTQKSLTGSKPAKALPPGRTTPTGNPPSARRADAAARQARAAQGSKGSTTRTATSSNANRLEAAKRQINDPTIKRIVRQHDASQKRGGPLTAALSIIGNKIIDKAAPHIIRGGMKVAGIDTKGYDRGRSGKPVIKSVNGVDFNVATKAGQRGYQKAMVKKNQSYKKTNTSTTSKSKPTQSSSTPQRTSTTKTNTTSKTTTPPKKDRGKRDYGSKEKNLSAWAKANPKLAKRLEEKKKAKAKRRAGGTLYSGRTGNSNIG